MLTAEQNDLLTRIGPGTPAGNLLRRYWQPIAATSELADRWTMRVRLLGEDLVLFRDRQGASRPGQGKVPASRRVAVSRHPDAGRHPVSLSRLGIRPHRPMPEPAQRARAHLLQGQDQDRGLSGRRAQRHAVRLSRPGAAAAAAALGRLHCRRLDPDAGTCADSDQLAAGDGELARPDPHRVAARTSLRVRQGAAGRQPPRSRSARSTRRSRSANSNTASPSIACWPVIRRIPTTGASVIRWCFPTCCRSATATKARATMRSRSACRSTTPIPCTCGTRPTCRRRARTCRRTCSTRSTSTTCRGRTRTAISSSTTSTART